ncbi:MAG: DUF362 domain-containing protein [Anaerolineaceae bacterium]
MTDLDNVLQKNRSNALVAIQLTKPSKNDVFESVRKAMELAKWKNFISRGAKVVLKPNLGWDKLIPGAISSPWVVEAVILVIRDYVSEISIIESDQVVCNVEKVIRLTGIYGLCEKYNISWVNMSRGKFIQYKSDERLVLHDVKIPEILSDTELITIPLMKTHNKSTITGAIKNQWGCLQELRHNFHPVLSKALVDVCWFTQPRFAVMDATIALEGNGPKSGIPKEMNMVLASGNIVGIDATAARIMGINPHEIEHLNLCAEFGYGSLDPVVIGAEIESIKTEFIPAKHNLVSKAEIILRKTFFSKLLFQTPLLKFLTFITRRYYDIWDFFIGKRIRKEISKSGYFTAFSKY